MQQRLESRGYSGRAATRLVQAIKPSTVKQYDSKWNGFSFWCQERGFNRFQATVPIIADFLCFLFEELHLAPSTHKSAIVDTLKFDFLLSKEMKSSLV